MCSSNPRCVSTLRLRVCLVSSVRLLCCPKSSYCPHTEITLCRFSSSGALSQIIVLHCLLSGISCQILRCIYDKIPWSQTQKSCRRFVSCADIPKGALYPGNMSLVMQSEGITRTSVDTHLMPWKVRRFKLINLSCAEQISCSPKDFSVKLAWIIDSH